MDFKTQYDTIGPQYIKAQKEFLSQREDWAKQFIVEQLAPIKGKMILDVGCGHGEDVQKYNSLGANALGLDSSEYMISQARKRMPVDLVQHGQIEMMPYADQTFDAVVSRFGFHYLQSHQQSFSEIARVLKPDGLISLIIPNPEYDALFMNEEYGSYFVVQMPLFNGKSTVTYPHVPLEDFFCAAFKKNFLLNEILPYHQPEVSKKFNGVASALAVTARKIT